MSSSTYRIVVWFRNDLRIHDSAPLYQAAQLVQQNIHTSRNIEIVPVYCFDPRYFSTSDQVFHRQGFGAQKTGYFRAKFILESVLALKQRLQSIGSDLLILVGEPEELLPNLLNNTNRPLILASAEVAPEEKQVENAVKDALNPMGGILKLFWTNSLYDHSHVIKNFGGHQLPNLQGVFTKFKNTVEKKCDIPEPLPTPGPNSLPLPENMQQFPFDFTPTLQDLPWTSGQVPRPSNTPDTTAFPWTGGELTGLQRVEDYFFQTDAVANYFNTRNGMLGTDYSTKLAPWLSVGALSVRYVISRLAEYEQQIVENKSTYWVKFELTWRDFFWYFTLKHGSKIFEINGVTGKHQNWSRDRNVLNRWKSGQTGMPLVDANMRELLQTGWMSNRGRQNVASYLIHDLGIDWRMGAEHFEEYLLDYDPASNWGNWVAAAGLTGSRINRFNVTKQGRDYDPLGKYVRTWIPDLKHVSNEYIHSPWKMPEHIQRKSKCIIGTDYFAPMKSVKAYVKKGGKTNNGKKRKRYKGFYKSNQGGQHY